MPDNEFIFGLDFVELDQKNLLPHYSGIYYVVDTEKTIWYIGISRDLNQRWNGVKPHHRYSQLRSLSTKQQKSFLIYYHQVAQNKLIKEEKKLITKYQPLLNNTKIIGKPFQKNNLEKSSFNNLQTYNNLNILSNFTKLNNNTNTIKHKSDLNNENILNMTNITQANNVVGSSATQFERKFIHLIDESIGLNLELEICIDPQKRFFVRHYAFTYICGQGISVINEFQDDEQRNKLINNTIQGLYSKLKILHNPIRWIGYKLKCENLVVIDEEDRLEIETMAIMLPFRMFVNLTEDIWTKNTSLFYNLKNEKDDWFR